MKAKTKASKRNWSLKTKLELHVVILSCSFFFLAGFFSSNLLSQDQPRARPRQLQSVEEETRIKYDLLPSGRSGDDSITVIPSQVLSWKPRALFFPKFATAEQCQSIIDMAKPSLSPSTLFLRKGETEESTKGIRTSFGTFLSASADPTGVLDAIEGKIAKATRLPRSNYEPFNVLRYEIGQKYDAHFDAFSPAEYGPQKSQRVATFLIYLSETEEGGETMFPFEDDRYFERYDFKKCIGLRVKPRRGDGLLFYSMFPNNTIDPASLHGSCPVIKGQKWVVTKWIRDQEIDF